MKFTIKSQSVIKVVVGMVVGLSFLLVTLPSQGAEIKFLKTKHGQSQEQMGSALREAGWLRYNRGIVQEQLGKFIQEGGQSLDIEQEALGSGIAAAAHIQWQTMRVQEVLGSSVLKVAQVVRREAEILGPPGLQKRLDAVIIAAVQRKVLIEHEANLFDQANSGIRQVAMGQQIQKDAGVKWASALMADAANAVMAGQITAPVPGSAIASLRAGGAFGVERNFRLAMDLLERETGRPLTQLLAASSSGISTASLTGSATGRPGGMGGFAEYGFWSLAGLLFVGWMFSHMVIADTANYEVKEEESWEYKEAA